MTALYSLSIPRVHCLSTTQYSLKHQAGKCTEEKTPKNRLTETLEPHKQNIGAPKLVSRYQIHSLYTLQLSGCCQLTLEAETK